MAAFKLGATDITAAYLGTQGICIINDGADTVFDAACGAQFTVTHTVSDGISGSGYTISTTPSSSTTGSTGDAYSFTTTVSADSGYEFTSGPTISPSQPVTGVIGSANSTVNTTVTGTVQVIYNPQNVTATYNLVDQIQGGLPGGYTVTPPTNQTPTGLANPTFSYDFTPGFAITLTSPGYEWSGGTTPNIAGLTGTISSSQTRDVTISNATVVKTQYQVTGTQTNNISGPSAGYNLTFDGSSITSTGDTNVIKQGTVTDADWSFVTTLTGPNAGYNASQALSLSSGSTTGAWGDNTTPVTSVSTGTVALANTDVTVTLSYDTSGFTGAANATFSTGSGLTRAGNPGTPYSFSTTITADSTYSFSGTSPQVLNGTFPSTSQGVTQYLTGTVSRPTLYSVDRSASPGGCGVFQGSSYWWPDPLGYLTGSSEANDVAPSGTQVYADSNYGSYSSTAGTYSITEPNTGADMTQYISSTGTVGTDNSCP